MPAIWLALTDYDQIDEVAAIGPDFPGVQALRRVIRGLHLTANMRGLRCLSVRFCLRTLAARKWKSGRYLSAAASITPRRSTVPRCRRRGFSRTTTTQAEALHRLVEAYLSLG